MGSGLTFIQFVAMLDLAPKPAKPNVRPDPKPIAMVRAGTSTTSFLQVVAQPGEGHEDLDALLPVIASTVLNLHPDLLGNQVLIVQVQRRFDLGIAGWSQSHRETRDATGWRERLARLRARVRKI